MTVLVPAIVPVTVVVVPPVVTDTPVVLVQFPPAIKSLKVIDEPLHIDEAPPIPEGSALTVTTTVVATPAIVYEIVAVPTATPVTMPDVPTVAAKVLAECHVPPVAASVKAVVDPTHTLSAPVMSVPLTIFTVTG